jgi:Na+/proline symporter
VGLKGLLVTAFFAAYMSTIATHLNWGTSYIINDFYRRFMVTDKTEKHYVLSSRITTLLLMVLSIVVTTFISRISGAWEFILQCGAGLGSVLILRWFWWRINAWSEIAAMITPFIIFPIVSSMGIKFPISLFYLVAGTTIVWLVVTFLTRPTAEEKLKEFYTKIHPGGILWKRISDKLPEVKSDSGFGAMFVNWLFGVILVYSSLFGLGSFIFGDYTEFTIYLILAAISAVVIYRNLSKIGWEVISE